MCSSIFFDLINLRSCDFTLLVTANLSHKGEGCELSEVKITFSHVTKKNKYKEN